MTSFYRWAFLFLFLVLISGCVPGDGSSGPEDPAGFWWGMWHGFIALVSLIWSFIDSSVNIYEVYNNGWWYDLGFMLPWLMGFGIGASHKSSRD